MKGQFKPTNVSATFSKIILKNQKSGIALKFLMKIPQYIMDKTI